MAEVTPLLVRAKFAFSGKNNDELSFRKNEIITITQQIEGGWWEGTLNGLTGWFPSNYVDILDADNVVPVTNGHGERIVAPAGVATDRKAFRAQVVRDFIAAEKLYVTNLSDTMELYLQPVQEGLFDEDYHTLSFNFPQIVAFQQNVYTSLETNLSMESREQKVGKILLDSAAELKSLLLDYCWNHPRAIEVVNEKEAYLSQQMTSLNKTMADFIARLSEPFRHLDRYPPFLQELERSIEEDHQDRGNIQRACVIYKDIKGACEGTRKQKEAHMELFHAAPIEQWANFDERGKILYVGIVTVRQEDEEKERCVAVFTKMILVMEIAASNAYNLVTKIPVANLFVKRIEGGFSITFGEKEIFISTTDYDEWLKAFLQMDGAKVENNQILTARPPTPQQRPQRPQHEPTTPTSITAPDGTPFIRPREKKSSGDFKLNHDLGLFVPDIEEEELESPEYPGGGLHRQKSFSVRPAPLQRCNSSEGGKRTIKLRKESKRPILCTKALADPIVDPDDTVLLKIVEGYCGLSSGKTTLPSFQQPQLIVAENEKILIEEVVGDEVVIQEKSLVDTVYSLKDQITNLQSEVSSLTRALDREIRSRRRLEESVRKVSDLPASPQSTN